MSKPSRRKLEEELKIKRGGGKRPQLPDRIPGYKPPKPGKPKPKPNPKPKPKPKPMPKPSPKPKPKPMPKPMPKPSPKPPKKGRGLIPQEQAMKWHKQHRKARSNKSSKK